jgi:hypothetical protein
MSLPPTGLYGLLSGHSTHLDTSHRFPPHSPDGPPTRTVITPLWYHWRFTETKCVICKAIKHFQWLGQAPSRKLSSMNWTKSAYRSTDFSLTITEDAEVSTGCHRPVSRQLVLPSRDVLWASAIHLPLRPPLLHRTTKISPPLLLPLEARKQARLSDSLSVAPASPHKPRSG